MHGTVKHPRQTAALLIVIKNAVLQRKKLAPVQKPKAAKKYVLKTAKNLVAQKHVQKIARSLVVQKPALKNATKVNLK